MRNLCVSVRTSSSCSLHAASQILYYFYLCRLSNRLSRFERRVSLPISTQNYVELRNHFFYISEIKQYHKYMFRQEEMVHVSELVVIALCFLLDCFLFVIDICLCFVQRVLLCVLSVHANWFSGHDVLPFSQTKISSWNRT